MELTQEKYDEIIRLSNEIHRRTLAGPMYLRISPAFSYLIPIFGGFIRDKNYPDVKDIEFKKDPELFERALIAIKKGFEEDEDSTEQE